jgi:hypothetical protein
MATTSLSRKSTLAGILMAAAVALGACAIPLPLPQGSPAAADPTTSSRAPAADLPTTAPSAEISAPGPGVDGNYGQFTSLSEACLSVSATMLSVTLLPLAALVGGNPEDLEKARQELSQMQGKVPEELKPAFVKLRNYTESAGTDFGKFGEPEFEELLKPVEDWMDKNCK